MQWIERAKRGEEKLATVFWLGAVCPMLAALLIELIGKKIIGEGASEPAWHWLWLNMLITVYEGFAGLLVFRCIHNTPDPLMGRAALTGMIFIVMWSLHSVLMSLFPPQPPFSKHAVRVHDIILNPANPVNYRSQCLEEMKGFALNHHVNPDQYIAQNQSYLQKCTQYLMDKNAPQRKQ